MSPGPACCAPTVMKQRAFYLLFTCVLFTCLFIILLPVQKPRTLHNFVKETQKKILKLHENLLSAGDVEPGRPSSASSRHQINPNPDAQLKQLLGLPPYPLHLVPPGPSEDLMVVTSVAPGQLHHVPGFVHAATHLQSEFSILIHDLGLSRRDKETLNHMCNSTLCQVSQFDFLNWPNHVKDLKLQAYRPILIQLGLRETRLLLWMDIDTRIINFNIKPWLDRVKSSYILTWPQQPLLNDGDSGGATPTTALTHPRMFEYFPQTQKEDYEFQHMVTGRCVLFYLGNLEDSEEPSQQDPAKAPAKISNNDPAKAGDDPPASDSTLTTTTPPLITSLMVPWLKCVLIEDCINPIGAQSTGCRFDKKPKYRYSGCHSYDVSALNIVLGEMFSFHESVYMSNTTFYKRVNPTLEVTSTAPLNTSDYSYT